MKPILYNATETVFDSYGLGEIDANKATVTRERNGNYSLYIEYPVGGSLTPLFKQDMRIKADAGVRTKNQTFYISRIVKDSSHVIKIYAKHISHLTETMGIVHGTIAAGNANAALARWSESLVGGVEFRTSSDIETEGKTSWTVDKFKTAREALGGVEGSILDVWGGEYEFDNTTIRLHKQLGRKTPTILQYGRNILSAEEDENSESSYTSIYPYASYTLESSESGRQADPVFVTLPEKIVDSQWVKMYADRRVQVVDFSSKFAEKETPTLDKLRKMAERYVHDNRIGLPKKNIRVEYVDLAKTLDYADMAFMEEVELCDIVPIFYPKIGLTNEDGKVVVVNYDVLNDRNESIEIGTIGQGMKSAMVGSFSERLETLESRQTTLENNIPAYLLDGKGNKVWYQKPDDKREHKVGDTWFEKNGLYNRIYVWNGEIWEKRIDTEDVSAIDKKVDDKLKEFKASTDLIKQKTEEALKSAGASNSLAEEAKRISELVKTQIDNLKSSSQTAIEQIESFKAQYGTKLNEVQSTADGLSIKMGVIETYISKDGQRQEELKRYAREESASQTNAIREQISKDYVGKNTFQESVQGVERRLESLSLGTSGNLLKNSNDGFYNQHDKRYRLVETLQANQTYTLVTKYWNGENATGHTFFDGVDWRRLNYNQAIDAWMVQFTPTKEIPAGTEITLSSDPFESQGNMDWATLVRGAIPLIHWQPAKGDVEEGVTQKLAEYKETVDGRFATISSQIDNKANQSDFQSVKETSQLYERIIGRNENDISNKVARMALTSQLFQLEVGKYASQGGPNLIKNSGNPQDNKDWGYWEIGQTPKLNVASHSFFYNEKRKLFSLTNNTKIGVPASTIRFSLKRNTNYTVALTAFNTWNMKGATIYFLGRKSGENQTFTRVVTLADNVKFSSDEAVRKNYTFNSGECDEGFIRIDNNGTNDNQEAILLFGDVDVYEGTTIRPWQPSPEDSNEAVRSVQSQLDGSWSVQNLTSAGALVSGLNLGANGHNRLDGKLTHITGETLIDKAVIKSAHISSIDAANGKIFNLSANNFTANRVEGLDLVGGNLSATNGAMKIDLNKGQYEVYTEKAALRRVVAGYPNQFIKFDTGNQDISGNREIKSGVTVIGSNSDGTENGNNQTFAGIQIWNNPQQRNVNSIGDFLRVSNKGYGSDEKGWIIQTIDTPTIAPIVDKNKPEVGKRSAILSGDFYFINKFGQKVSLLGILERFIVNFNTIKDKRGILHTDFSELN